LLLMPLSVEHSTPQQNKVVQLPVKLLQVTQQPTLLLLLTLLTKSMTLLTRMMVAGQSNRGPLSRFNPTQTLKFGWGFSCLHLFHLRA
jgi:hypothetical protein